MKKSFVLLFSALFIGSGLATSISAAERYNLDPVHSSVLFKIEHSEISYFFGRFNDFSADINWDEEAPDNNTISFVIKPESVDTANQRRDTHLRSPDFFNARQFPEITFTSSKVTKTGDDTFAVTGDLVLLGQSKPVDFVWTQTGSGQGSRGEFRRGGIATFSIKRSDFGMDYMLDRLGDQVELTVSLQTIRQ